MYTQMKKIFTLIAGLFMAAAVMAADHNPDLTIRNSRNFKIVIDGRSFYSNNAFLRINNIPRGHHRIEVFEMRRSYFGQRERLVSATSFKMGKQDMRINVDYNGRVQVMNEYNRYDRNDRNNRDNDWGWDRSGRDQRNYDQRDYDHNDQRDYGQRNDRQYDRTDENRPYDRRNDDRPIDRRDDDNRRY